ncbi:MAG: hypothetical protein ABNH33_07705, partial [Glaciecola sp.]
VSAPYAETPAAVIALMPEAGNQLVPSSDETAERKSTKDIRNNDVAEKNSNSDKRPIILDEPSPVITSLPTANESEQSSRDSELSQYSREGFYEWKTISKSRVKDEMDAILPNSIRDAFIRKINTPDYFSDISSLNEEQLTGLDIDMVTHIRDFISVHQFGNQVEIIDLECVQLTCRLFGRASDPVKWQQVYVELIFSFSKLSLVQNERNTQRGVTFVDPGSNSAFFYHQISMQTK